jgi:hypothetical protein
MSDLFGPIVTGHDVEEAVRDHLKEWSVTYLAEMERLTGRDPETLPKVRSWTIEPDEPATKWPEDQFPAVVVVSPGLVEQPYVEGDGTVYATWTIGLAALTSARTEQATRELAKVYAAHLRAIMLQRPSIGGFASDTHWLDEDYNILPTDTRRSLAAGYLVFNVTAAQVLNVYGGPTEPPDEPYEDPADWPTVDTTEVTAEKQ